MFEIQVNARELKAAIAAAPEILRKAIRQRANAIRTELRRDLRAQIARGSLIEPRSGKLRRSVFGRVKMSDEGLEIRVGAARFTAPILEKGATVTPKRAAHVTVPLPAALDGRGLKMFSARDVIGNPRAYGYLGTFTLDDVIFGRRGDDAVPLFALKKRIRIEPRRFIRSVWDARKDWITRQFADAVAEAVTAIARGHHGG